MRERKIDYSMKYSTGSVHALHLSAVHPDIGPGHIARIRTGDHANDMGDLLHPPDAADGNRRQLARGAGLRLLQRYVASAHIQPELASQASTAGVRIMPGQKASALAALVDR